MKFSNTIRLMAGASALAALLAAVPASADDNKLQELKDQGFARVAIANEPPFTAVAADGKVSGASPDVAREIFKRLGVTEIVASISEYGAMIPGLQAHRHDVITAGLFMKPERCAAVAYSEPILCDAEAMLVKFLPRPKSPFQGWRYLDSKDAPADLSAGGFAEEGDAGLAEELARLGLI